MVPPPRPHLLLLALALARAAAAAPPDLPALTARIERLLPAVMPAVRRLRREFHRHPELANQEVRTARKVAARLRELGVDRVRTGVAPTGVIAEVVGAQPGPVVLVRADMDALPLQEATGLPYSSEVDGVMHACGHDAHTAILLGVADVLVRQREHLRGTARLVFQPAEEGGVGTRMKGARAMIEAGLLDSPRPAAALALHSHSALDTGKLGVTVGPALAGSANIDILVRARGGHAAYPWEAKDAVLAASHVVVAMQSVVSRHLDARKGTVLSFGQIQGGSRRNILPRQVSLAGTLRYLAPESLAHARLFVPVVARSTAAAYGARAEVRIDDPTPPTVNDPALTRWLWPVLEGAAGEGNVVEELPAMATEDFSYIADAVPSTYFQLGMRPPGVKHAPPPHSPGFRVDEDALPLGVRALAAAALAAGHREVPPEP